MLKKILPIFFILCLVFSLTVSCFAVETDPPDYQHYFEQVFLRFDPNGDSTVLPGSNRTHIQFLGGAAAYGGLKLSDPSLIKDGHTYLVTMTVSSSAPGNIRFNLYSNSYYFQRNIAVSTESAFVSFTFTGLSNTTYIWIFRSAEGNTDVIDNLNIIDVTGVSNPSDYLDFNRYNPSGYYQIHNFYQPFLDFHSHLFETFSFFPELGSTYSALFTFVIIITSVLVFIFLVVFMIKRFTGGKT